MMTFTKKMRHALEFIEVPDQPIVFLLRLDHARASENHIELLSKPLLTLNAIQHLRFPIAFSTFGVLRIWGYRSIVLYT